jgi:hypothetical protein
MKAVQMRSKIYGFFLFFGVVACGEGTVAPGDPRDFLGQGDIYAPQFRLIGDSQIRLERAFDSYVELGAQAQSLQEGDLSDRIVILGEVDVSKAGQYVREYLLLSPSGAVLEVLTREVQVEDTRAPTGQLQIASFPSDISSQAGPRNLLLSASEDEDDPIENYRAAVFFSSNAFASDFCQSQDLSSVEIRSLATPFEFTAQEGYQVICALGADEFQNFQAADRSVQSNNLRVISGIPQVEIESPSNGAYVAQNRVSVSGSCSHGDSFLNPSVELSGDLQAFIQVACDDNGQFSAEVQLTVGDGEKNIRATQSDIAGNIGQSERQVLLDTTPPTIDFGDYASISWVLCEDFLSVEDLRQSVYFPSAMDSTSSSVDLEILSVDSEISWSGGSIEYRATDLAGNSTTAVQMVSSTKVVDEVLFAKAWAQTSQVRNAGNIDQNILICADLDFQSEDFSGLGNLDSPVDYVIEGQQHKIQNLTLVSGDGDSAEADQLAFIRVLGSEGILKNLRFESSEVFARDQSAIAVGLNFGRLEGVRIETSTVNGRHELGGLVGRNEGRVVRSSIDSLSSISSLGNLVGGLVGAQAGESTSLFDSYSLASVTGVEMVGGLLGLNSMEATVGRSYSTAPNLQAVSGMGGLIGLNEVENSVSYSYWNTDTSGLLPSDPAQVDLYGQALSDIEMRTPQSYDESWSDEIWLFMDGEYPQLLN